LNVCLLCASATVFLVSGSTEACLTGSLGDSLTISASGVGSTLGLIFCSEVGITGSATIGFGFTSS
jgi:hypothetical protein